MGGRNNKLRDQKDLDQKGSGRQRNPPKEILPRVKRTISKAYGWTKNLYNLYYDKKFIFASMLAYLGDVLQHLNDLNCLVQEKRVNIVTACDLLRAFR